MNPNHIKRLELLNYGPFPSTVLDGFGLTTSIQGKNGAGKTFLVKAIVAVVTGAGIEEEDCYNDPRNTKVNKSASITVEWYDGRRVELSRAGAGHSWRLITPGQEPVLLSGVKDAGVREAIQQFTGFVPLQIDKETTELLQYQALGAPNLLLASSRATVMRVINSLAGGGHLEHAIKLAVSESLGLGDQLRSKTSELESLRADRRERALTAHRQIDALLNRIEKLRTTHGLVVEDRKRITELRGLLRVAAANARRAAHLADKAKLIARTEQAGAIVQQKAVYARTLSTSLKALSAQALKRAAQVQVINSIKLQESSLYDVRETVLELQTVHEAVVRFAGRSAKASEKSDAAAALLHSINVQQSLWESTHKGAQQLKTLGEMINMLRMSHITAEQASKDIKAEMENLSDQMAEYIQGLSLGPKTLCHCGCVKCEVMNK